MVAHFEIPARRIQNVRRANSRWRSMPGCRKTFACCRRSRVPEKFHARFDAAGKQYRYFVWNHPAMNPLLRHTAWHVPRPLNLKAMRAAAPLFVGRHDFKSFAASRNYEMDSTVRTAHALRHQKIRRAADVHHRRRRISLQNVPGHRRHAGASRAGQISAGRNQADAGQKGPARGRHDRPGAWAWCCGRCFIRSKDGKSEAQNRRFARTDSECLCF